MQPFKPNAPPFDEFYKENYERVLYYIVKKIGSIYDAQDLAGEVFAYCYSHYGDYDPEKSSLTTWLYLIVNSRLKNHYRDSRTYVELESVAGELSDETVDMDACIYLQQLRQQLDKALTQLPERQRRIVTMRYFEDRSNSEIARELGMTQVNVRVQLSRALDKLEKLCENLLEGV